VTHLCLPEAPGRYDISSKQAQFALVVVEPRAGDNLLSDRSSVPPHAEPIGDYGRVPSWIRGIIGVAKGRVPPEPRLLHNGSSGKTTIQLSKVRSVAP